MLVKIDPKSKLVQETYFPHLILALISGVLHVKVIKPMRFHSTQSKHQFSCLLSTLAHRMENA